jgi:hypothetical protein
MMYVDPETNFKKQHFQMFFDMVEDHSYTISQEWVTGLHIGSESLAFQICGHTYPTHSLCPTSSKKLSMSRADFEGVITLVKGECRDAYEVFIVELDKRFPDSELMNALAIMFPQFWLQRNCNDLFSLHMKTLRSHFCVARNINRGTMNRRWCRWSPCLMPEPWASRHRCLS